MTDTRIRVQVNDSWETFIKMVFNRWLKKQDQSKLPVNTGLPFFLNNQPSVGTVITLASINPGTWSNNPILVVQLKRNGIIVPLPYPIVAEDEGVVFHAFITATNTAGSVNATSAPTNPTIGVTAPPLNTILPSFVDPTPSVGDIIDNGGINLGNWSGNPPPQLSVILRKDGVSSGIPYTVQIGDIGSTFDLVVTGTNIISSMSVVSNPTSPVTSTLFAPTNVTAPTWKLTTYRVGDIINDASVNAGSYSGNPVPTLAYVLKVGGVTKTKPYTILVGDIGSTMVMEETATNSQGSDMEPTAASTAIVAALAAPVNTVAPTLVDTTPVVGDIIATTGITDGTWTGNPTPTLTKSLEKGGLPVILPYTVISADIGLTFVGKVTGTNTEGSAVGATSASSAVTAPLTAPVKVTDPTFFDTTPTVGDVINNASISQGSFTGNPVPTLTNQFKKNGSNISVPYTIVSGDVGATFTVVVTATNSQGSTSGTSAATSAVASLPVAPSVTVAPTWINANPVVGNVLSSASINQGTYAGTPTPTLSFQLFRTNGAGAATGSPLTMPFTVPSGDVGVRYQMVVTATNSQGNVAVGTPATQFVTAAGTVPAVTSAPFFIDTTPVVGDTINNASVNQGTWTGSPTPTLVNQFKKNGVNITVPYVVQSSDSGSTFSVTVTATNSNGSATASSASTSPVDVAAPAGTVAPLDYPTTPPRNYFAGPSAGIELWWAGRTWGLDSSYQTWSLTPVSNNEIRFEVRTNDRMDVAGYFTDSVGVNRNKLALKPNRSPTEDMLVVGKVLFEAGPAWTHSYYVLSEYHVYGTPIAHKFEIGVRNNCWLVTSNYNAGYRTLWENILPIVRDVWNNLMWFVRSHPTNGRVVVDINGVRRVDFTGYVGYTSETSCAPEIGQYRGTSVVETTALRIKDFNFTWGAYNTLTIPPVGGTSYGPELYPDGGFSATTGLIFTNTTGAISGGQLQLTTTIAGGDTGASKFLTGLTIGATYRAKGKVRRGTCTQVYMLVYSTTTLGQSAMVTATTLTDVEFNFTATATTASIYAQMEGTAIGQTGFFEDFSIMQVL